MVTMHVPQQVDAVLFDMDGDPTQQLPASTCHGVELTLRPFQIVTLRVSQ